MTSSGETSSLIKQLKEDPESVIQPIIDNGEKIIDTGKDFFGIIDRDKDKLIQQVSEKSREAVEFYSASNEKELAEKMIEEKDGSSEILMMIDESGKQRVFVPA